MKTLKQKIDHITRLRDEAAQIAAGTIGFPRCVEWQAEFVSTCYTDLPSILDAADKWERDHPAASSDSTCDPSS